MNKHKKPVGSTDEEITLSQYAQEPTGAVRESIGTKIKTHLVPYEYIAAAAVGLNYGEEKYSARNFEKGMSETTLLASIDRHTRALMDGEVTDVDSGLRHEYLLCSSVAMYIACKMRGTILPDLPTKALRNGYSLAYMAELAQRDLQTGLDHLHSKTK